MKHYLYRHRYSDHTCIHTLPNNKQPPLTLKEVVFEEQPPSVKPVADGEKPPRAQSYIREAWDLVGEVP
jgi:hypothetical protein